MNSISFGLVLSVNISYFDNKYKISLLHQSKIVDVPTCCNSGGIIDYSINNILHRTGGPACIYYLISQKKGVITTRKEYYNEGYLHRINGPAVITNKYDDDHRIIEWYYAYYVYGIRHCINGPAALRYQLIKNNKTLVAKSYWENGKGCSAKIYSVNKYMLR